MGYTHTPAKLDEDGHSDVASAMRQCKTITEDADAQMKIHPKVDSKKQRRVQCSFNIDRLIKAGIEYDCKPIRLTVKSKTRTFNK